MKKSFLLLTLAAICFAACDPTKNKKEEDIVVDRDYIPHYYYSFKLGKVFEIDGTSGAYTGGHYCMSQSGDYLYIGVTKDSKKLVEVLDKKTGAVVKTIEYWKQSEVDRTFHPFGYIFAGEDYLYVDCLDGGTTGTYLHVFDKKTYEYLGSQGNGGYGMQGQAGIEVNYKGINHMIHLCKQGQMKVFQANKFEPGKNVLEASGADRQKCVDMTGDNSFRTYQMQEDKDGDILLATNNGQTISAMNKTKLVQGLTAEEFEVKSKRVECMLKDSTKFNPTSLVDFETLLIVTGRANALTIYDKVAKEWLPTSLKTVAGHEFSSPNQIIYENDSTLWVSDPNKRQIVELIVIRNEIREYQKDFGFEEKDLKPKFFIDGVEIED